jgi:hypothetical protein
MALWELDEFKPPQMLGFIRSLPVPAGFSAVNWLPDRTINDLEFEYILGSQSKPVMAHVMGFDSEAPIHGRPGLGARISGELPPIKRKARIGEKTIIRFMAPRSGLPDVDDAINSVYRTAAELVTSVQARAEWLRAQSVSEDTVVYNEGGVILNMDYQITNRYQITLGATAGTAVNGAGATESAYGPRWDDYVNANAVLDLQKLSFRIRTEKGVALARTVMAEKTLNDIFQQQKVRDMIRGTGAGVPQTLLTRGEIDAVFAQYSIPPIELYDVFVTKENADGTYTDVRCMRENAVVLQPVSLGETLWGPTAESRVLFGTPLAAAAAGIWAETYGTTEPPAEWTKVAATAIPTLPAADKLGQMTVRLT